MKRVGVVKRRAYKWRTPEICGIFAVVLFDSGLLGNAMFSFVSADRQQMAMSLSHSLNRFKLRFSPEKLDTMIIQAVGGSKRAVELAVQTPQCNGLLNEVSA